MSSGGSHVLGTRKPPELMRVTSTHAPDSHPAHQEAGRGWGHDRLPGHSHPAHQETGIRTRRRHSNDESTTLTHQTTPPPRRCARCGRVGCGLFVHCAPHSTPRPTRRARSPARSPRVRMATSVRGCPTERVACACRPHPYPVPVRPPSHSQPESPTRDLDRVLRRRRQALPGAGPQPPFPHEAR